MYFILLIGFKFRDICRNGYELFHIIVGFIEKFMILIIYSHYEYNARTRRAEIPFARFGECRRELIVSPQIFRVYTYICDYK